MLAPWVALTTLACAPAPPAQVGTPVQDVMITLERGPCFGTCPVYRVSVDGTGRVRYDGVAHVVVVGQDSTTIAGSDVERLVAEFDRIGYGQFANQYTAGQPTCPSYVPDAPTAITSLSRNGVTKRVAHDYGCADAPRALTALERLIDETVDSGRWTGRGAPRS